MTTMPQAKVLLVEDEGLIRMMVAEFLQDEGFAVAEAGNADEAMRLLDGPDAFHILFTDVQMPGRRDGVDVAVHARRLYPRIPILIASGYAAALMDRISVLDPAALFISKPYRLWEVGSALRGMRATP